MADEFDPMFGDALPMGTRVGPTVLGGAIGQGAEGLIYLAEHDRLGRVVVKEFWPKQIASRSNSGVVRVSQPRWQEAYRKACIAFTEKGERLCQLPQHPGVVRFHEVIKANGTVFLVMDQVQGISLSTLLDAGKAMELSQVRELADALTAAAGHLHANDLIHRDIAPDNIIVGADLARAVLIDLNAAKDEVQEGSQSLHGLVKAGYSPFEQYVGASSELDARSDIYAVAAVLIHALTGARPLVPLRRMELGPDDPDPLAKLPPNRIASSFIGALRHGFALRAADRPISIAAWRTELGLDQHDAPPPAPPRPAIEWRKPTYAVLSLLALIGSGYGLRAAWDSSPGSPVVAAPIDTSSDAPPKKVGSPVVAAPTDTSSDAPPKKVDRAVKNREIEKNQNSDHDRGNRGVKIVIYGSFRIIFFEWDQTRITPSAVPILESAANEALSKQCNSISVNGNVPGNSAYGRGLAARRAEAVRAFLTSRGVSDADISLSY